MTALDIALIVLGIVLIVGGTLLLRYLGRLSDGGNRWIRGQLGGNVSVFIVLTAWCGGLGLIGYGLGLSG